MTAYPRNHGRAKQPAPSGPQQWSHPPGNAVAEKVILYISGNPTNWDSPHSAERGEHAKVGRG